MPIPLLLQNRRDVPDEIVDQPFPLGFRASSLEDPERGPHVSRSRDEIRHALWMECVADSACEQTDQIKVAVGAITFPVTDINPMDIAKFIDWLNAKTNESWRLPTLSEWRDYYDRKELIEAMGLAEDFHKPAG